MNAILAALLLALRCRAMWSTLPNKSIKFPQLWLANVEDASLQNEAACRSLLSLSEYRRFKSIHSAAKQRQYLVSRWLIRHALSQTFNQPMEFWNIEEIRGQFPIIHNLPDDTFLSLSHSHDRIALAISDAVIGVDIERKIPRNNIAEMAELFMSAEELGVFYTHENRELYFYQTWCIKEAYYKSLPAVEQQKLSLQKIDSAFICSVSSIVISDKLPGYLLAIYSDKKLDAAHCFALNNHDQDIIKHLEL